MKSSNPKIAYLLAVIVYNSLYLPQPLLPLFVERYGSDMQTVSLSMSITVLMIGIFPPLYGVMMEKIQMRTVLAVAFVLLAAVQLLMTWLDSLSALIFLRGFQGLIFPAAFTALMTYIASHSYPAQTKRNMQLYILFTMIGGFFSRWGSGHITALTNRWSFYFIVSAVLLIAALPLIFTLRKVVRPREESFNIGKIPQVLSDPIKLKIYLTVFLGFFIFTALMNYVPFRVVELSGNHDESTIAFMYLGYLGGIASIFLLKYTQKWITSDFKLIMSAIFGGLPFLVGMATENYLLLTGLIFLYTALFSIMHSCNSGFLNHIAIDSKPTVNGLYVGFYYFGGSLGSLLPGFFYRWAGWYGFLAFLILILLLQFYTFYSLKTTIKSMTS